MDLPRSPPPPYSPSPPNSPPPPYRPPLPPRSSAVQQAAPDPALSPPLQERPKNIDREVVASEPSTVHQVPEPTPQVPRPDVDEDEESQAHAADPNKNERTEPDGEYRAEHGKGCLKIRLWSWVMQLAVWALFLGALISLGRYRAVQKANEGLRILDDDYKDDGDEFLSLLLFGLFFVLVYFFYLDMCKDAGTWEFVKNLDRELNVQQYVQQLRTTMPAMRFNASCYHYETRTRTVPHTTTDMNGNSTTTYRTETYLETVVTHTANEEYSFTQWEDATAALSFADVGRLTKLRLSKELEFLTDAGKQQFETAYISFCAANRRDVYQTFKQDLHIEGFKERILCFEDVHHPPCWVGICGYCISALIMVNLPYRVLLDWNTGVLRHTITKKIA